MGSNVSIVSTEKFKIPNNSTRLITKYNSIPVSNLPIPNFWYLFPLSSVFWIEAISFEIYIHIYQNDNYTPYINFSVSDVIYWIPTMKKNGNFIFFTVNHTNFTMPDAQSVSNKITQIFLLDQYLISTWLWLHILYLLLKCYFTFLIYFLFHKVFFSPSIIILFAYMWLKITCYFAKSCSHVWLYGIMDCSLSVSSACGIFQARILEQVTISYSRGSSPSRYQIYISCISCISR